MKQRKSNKIAQQEPNQRLNENSALSTSEGATLVERLRAGERETPFDEPERGYRSQEDATAASGRDMRQITPDQFETMKQQFEELFEREHDTIVEAARRRWCFNHQQNAENCVDEAFSRLWKQIACRGEVPPSPLGWLYKTARRVEINRARSAFARHGTLETVDEIASPEPGRDAELMEKLLQAMEQLPARYCRALSLKYLEEYSYVEIAEVMGRTPKAVQQILQRARNQLRNRLAHHAPILGTS